MRTYIKIRYRGKLKNPSDVHQLTTETEDICKSNGWSYRIWEESWEEPQTVGMGSSSDDTGTSLSMSFEGHAPLKGISFSIGESETIWLTFLPDGMLESLITLVNPVFFGNDPDFPWQRVKTGYDGPKSHIAMCKLFRYLEEKFFEVFEVLDESDYWTTGDDVKFSKWMNDLIHDERLLEEEMAVIMDDESLSKEQKRDMNFRLIKEFGAKYKRKG